MNKQIVAIGISPFISDFFIRCYQMLPIAGDQSATSVWRNLARPPSQNCLNSAPFESHRARTATPSQRGSGQEFDQTTPKPSSSFETYRSGPNCARQSDHEPVTKQSPAGSAVRAGFMNPSHPEPEVPKHPHTITLPPSH